MSWYRSVLTWLCLLGEWRGLREGGEKEHSSGQASSPKTQEYKDELSLCAQEQFTVGNEMVVRGEQHTVPGFGP